MLPRWGWFALVAVAVSFGMRALAKWSFDRGARALRDARTSAGLPPEASRSRLARLTAEPPAEGAGDAREERVERDTGAAHDES